MYVAHSRRFRLNWFERNRLDSLACEEATVVKLCNRQRYHRYSTTYKHTATKQDELLIASTTLKPNDSKENSYPAVDTR